MSQLTLANVSAMGQAFAWFPLRHFLDAAARERIGAVEVWGGSPHVCLEDWTLARTRWLARELEARSLRLSCWTPELLMYGHDIAAEDEGVRERAFQFFSRHLDIAADLGAPQMLMWSGTGYLTDDIEAAWARGRDSLVRLADRASRLGVRLALETLQPRETNLVNTLTAARRMLDDVGSRWVHSCLDTETAAVAGDTVDAYFEVLGARVGHVHLTDGAEGRLGSGHLALGDGTLPLGHYLEVLQRHGYGGFLTLEALNARYLRDPDAALHTSVEWLREHLP